MIRPVIALIILNLIGLVSIGYSQQFAFKINPFGYIEQNWNWNPQQYSIEGSWNKKHSAVLYFETGIISELEAYEGNYSSGLPSYQYSATKVYVKGFIPEFRYYLSKNKPAPFGLFTGAYFRYSQLKEVYSGNDYSYHPHQLDHPQIDMTHYKNTYNIGLIAGIKIPYRYVFAEFLVGLGYLTSNWKDESGREKMNPDVKLSSDDPPIAGRLELAIGIVFPPSPKKSDKSN